MVVNLGPTSYVAPFGPAVGSGSGLDYNPRCLIRDINPTVSRRGLTWQNVTNLLTTTPDYAALTGNVGRNGVHVSGHSTVGGFMVEPFGSPADPSFFLHHTQVDRMWAIWQSLDPSVRQNQLLGSTTWFNSKFCAAARRRSHPIPLNTPNIVAIYVGVMEGGVVGDRSMANGLGDSS